MKNLKRYLILLVALAGVCLYVALASAEVAADEGPWIQNPVNGHYYRLTEPMSWMDAEAQAVAWGGHLVRLNSWEEESWIQETFGDNEYFWIGFNDIEEEGNWVWSSGEPVDYTNWAEYEPNNHNNEDAAVMNWCWEGSHVHDPCLGDHWNDLPADVQLKGVVERSFQIDIKPGSDPNSINCNNEDGVIAVAILTTEDFDATTVDHTTVTFEGASETHVDKKSGEPRRHEEDVDYDGDTDLVFHFRLGDTGLTCGSTEGTLTGETFDGQAIEGSDAVRMITGGNE